MVALRNSLPLNVPSLGSMGKGGNGNAVPLMGRGPDLDAETIMARKKLAEALVKNSLSPSAPEQSWSQGAARLAQSLVGNYQLSKAEKNQAALAQRRSADMQLLGQALTGGGGGANIAQVMSQLSDPSAQMMAFGLAKADMDRKNSMQNKYAMKNFDYGLKQQDYQRNRQDKLADMRDNRSFDIQKMGVKNEYQRGNLDYGSQLHREEKLADPVKAAQARYSEFARLATDENAPPEMRELAKGQLDTLKANIAAMAPPKTSVSVDTGEKAELAGLKTRRQTEEKLALDQEQENKKAALGAQDNLFRINEIKKGIESGQLTNLNTTNFGKALESTFARAGLPNDSAAVNTFIQSSNQQLVDARKQLQGQGPVTEGEQNLLAGTVLQPTDTMEALLAKIHVFNQVYDRQQRLGELTNEWINRYGSTTKAAPNGTNFNQAVTNLYRQRPLRSLEDETKAKQEAASAAVSQEIGG